MPTKPFMAYVINTARGWKRALRERFHCDVYALYGWSFWFLEIQSLGNILFTGVVAHGIYLLSQYHIDTL